MVDTSQNGTRQREQDGPTMRESLRWVLGDTVKLLHLQTQLLAVDTRLALSKALPAVVRLAIGAALALGAVPLILEVVAESLTMMFPNLTILGARAIVVGVGLLIATGLIRTAVRSLSQLGSDFDRSSTELAHNVEWLTRLLERDRCEH